MDGGGLAATLPLAMPLTYLAAGGLAWGVVFVAAATGVWRLWPWARKLVLAAIVVYQLHIWANHLIFDTSDYSRQVWPFHIGISVAWVVVVWGYMFLPGIRRLWYPCEGLDPSFHSGQALRKDDRVARR